MKGKKKILLGLVFALLLVVASVSLTLAYFTQTTSTKSNVFTVGNVSATLTEPNFDALTAEQKVLVPGRTIAKDPTITIGANSEAVYARMFVKIDTNFLSLLDTTVAGAFPTVKTGWTLANTVVSGNYTILEYRYNTVVAKSATATVLPTLFDNLKVKSTATTTQISAITDPTIQVVGQIVQTEGFADASAAFTAVGNPTGF